MDRSDHSLNLDTSVGYQFDRDPKIVPLLAEGNFSTTFRSLNSFDNVEYVVKEFDLPVLERIGIQKSILFKEILELKKLDNSYIAKYFNIHMSESTIMTVVMEFAEFGSISDKMLDSVALVDIVKWWNQLASALYYMHYEMNIQHRDIKPDNIKITIQGNVKLIGLKTSCIVRANASVARGANAAVYYSFEKANFIYYDGRDDVWAAGCVMAELMTKSRLKDRGGAVWMFANTVANDRRLKLISDCVAVDARYGDIVGRMIQPKQEDRCSSAELLVLLSQFSDLDHLKLLLCNNNMIFTNENLPPLLQVDSIFLANDSEMLGVGKCGSVHRRLYKDIYVAEKHFEFTKLIHYRSEAIKHEAYLLQLLSAIPTVVRFFGVDNSISPTVIYTECGIGTLKDVISEKKILGAVTLQEKLSILLQLCQTFTHLHALGVVHRDIKPSNMLLMSDRSFKVTDFRRDNDLFVNNATLSLPKGTHDYMAPELLMYDEYHYSEQTDLYAFAIMMNEVLTEQLPFLLEAHLLVTLMYETQGKIRPVMYAGPHCEVLVPEIEKRWGREPSRGSFSSLSQFIKFAVSSVAY